MGNSPAEATSPELIFGLVAPVGVDLNLVSEVLAEVLREMGYSAEAESFRLTQLMREIRIPQRLRTEPYVDSVRDRIDYANKIRERLDDDGLAALAVSAIRSFRAEKHFAEERAERGTIPPAEEVQLLREFAETPLRAQAYIVRQFKRPEEITLLRRVYGKQFIVVSAFATIEVRKRYIADAERRTRGGLLSEVAVANLVQELIAQDSMEIGVEHGQAVRDAFPLGDVFIDATSRKSCIETTRRFIQLLFGDNQITPSKDEYAMYLAKSASLRSSDLSRQIGAAIFSPQGEVMTLGCNEVPKAGGGTYWPGGAVDGRDFVYGFDPNERLKREVLVDLIDRLKQHGHLSEALLSKDDPYIVARELLVDESMTSVSKSKLMDIIEFGRIIHAEMSAITDAARKGVAVAGATLYCTTFPCHLCAKHIVAAGIRRVVFIEPYPKSYASDLHSDSIEIELRDHPTKVSFDAFIGISPYRYRDLFEKKSRKASGGAAQKWNRGVRRPMIEIYYPEYFRAETYVVGALARLLDALQKQAVQPAVPPTGKSAATAPIEDGPAPKEV